MSHVMNKKSTIAPLSVFYPSLAPGPPLFTISYVRCKHSQETPVSLLKHITYKVSTAT